MPQLFPPCRLRFNLSGIRSNVRMGDDEAEQLLDLAAELEERMRKLLLELYGNEELSPPSRSL